MKNNRRNNRLRNKRSNGLKRYSSSNIGRFRSAMYPYRVRPGTFGPGTYTLSVTKLISGSLNNEVVIDLYSDVVNSNPEFDRIREDFKYFKLKGFTVTFPPRNLPTVENQNPAYLVVNYDGKTTINYRLQDSVKIVPAFSTRNKVYKYKVPRINTFAGALNNWMVDSDLDAWGQIWIQLQAPDNNTTWQLRIDAIIIAKGPTTKQSSRSEMKIEDLKMVKKMNDGVKSGMRRDVSPLKEIKEEEEEKEEDNKIIRDLKENLEEINNNDVIREKNNEEFKEIEEENKEEIKNNNEEEIKNEKKEEEDLKILEEMIKENEEEDYEDEEWFNELYENN